MANLCDNSLEIIGAVNDIIDFFNKGIKTANEKVTSLEYEAQEKKMGTYKIINSVDDLKNLDSCDVPYLSAWLPMPGDLIEKHKQDNSNEEWFDWANNNWGVKWDSEVEMFDVTEEDGDLRVSLFYQTAWNGNCEWLINVGQEFPELTFILNAYDPDEDEYWGCKVEKGEVDDEYYDEEWLDNMREGDEDDWDDEDEDED